MSAPDERLTRIEAELDRLRPTLCERLDKLERTADKPPAKGITRFVAWMGPALPQLIGGAVLLAIAFWVKDSVDLAIRQQQLQLSYATEMKEQLETMAKDKATLDEVERAAVLVAGFGQPAVLPLMNELRHSGNRTLGAEAGLRSLAFMHPEAVCGLVLRVMKSPTRTLGWEGQMVASRTLAAASCASALPELGKHQRVVCKAVQDGDKQGLSALVKDAPGVTQQKEWLRSLEESIENLSAASLQRCKVP